MIPGRIEPAARVEGTLQVPGDKSLSHRAVILGAMAAGETRVAGFGRNADTLATLAVCRALGADITEATQADGDVVVTVRGRGFRAPAGPLDAANSGTTARVILGVLAGQRFSATLTGDASLRGRPMGRVVEPLRRMGATISGAEGGEQLPLTVRGGSLQGLRYTLPVASAQVKSALLLAGVQAQGLTELTEPVPTRDHTERLLQAFGAPIGIRGVTITVHGPAPLTGQALRIPGDVSAAAFWFVAAATRPGSHLTVEGVGLNPSRLGVVEVLRQMGARLTVTVTGQVVAGEPVGRVTVEGGRLHGTTVEGPAIVRAIDELPILMVAAALAEGETRIVGAGELRVKETDRIASMVANLGAMGAAVQVEGDTVLVRGGHPLRGGRVRTFGDHRTAMSLAVAALAAHGPTELDDPGCVGISYPGFFDALQRVAQR